MASGERTYYGTRAKKLGARAGKTALLVDIPDDGLATELVDAGMELVSGPRAKADMVFLGVASVGALAIGVVIFPFSLMGALLLIGLLGFTPLFTSFVLLRNSVRSFRAAKPLLERNLLANCVGLSAMTTAALTYLTYVWTR